MTRNAERQHSLMLIALVGLALGVALWDQTVVLYGLVGGDFCQDYFAARAARLGYSLFDPAVQHLADSVAAFGEVGNYHPPTLTLFFLPFSYLSYPAAFLLLSLASIILWLWLTWNSFCEFEASQPTRLLVLGLALLWYPFIYCIGTGQSSALIAALIWAGWLKHRRSQPLLTGLFWGLAASIKLFPALLVILLLLWREWRALFAMLATIVATVAAAALVFGTTDLWRYSVEIMPSQMQRFSSFILNNSLNGFFVQILTGSDHLALDWNRPVAAYWCSKIAIGLTLLLLVYAAKTLKNRKDKDLVIALYVTGMLLVSPLTWNHAFLLLAPVFALVATQNSGVLVRLLALLCFAGLSIPDTELTRYLVTTNTLGELSITKFFLIKLPFFALLGLLFLCLSQITKDGRSLTKEQT